MRLTAQHYPAAPREKLFWRGACLMCSEPELLCCFCKPTEDLLLSPLPNSRHTLLGTEPESQAENPIIRSHKSFLFWSCFHLSCFCHLHFYSLSYRWPGQCFAIFNNWALFLFELFFTVGFSSFRGKIGSIQNALPLFELALCPHTSHRSSRGRCSSWHSEPPCMDGELRLAPLWWCRSWKRLLSGHICRLTWPE